MAVAVTEPSDGFVDPCEYLEPGCCVTPGASDGYDLVMGEIMKAYTVRGPSLERLREAVLGQLRERGVHTISATTDELPANADLLGWVETGDPPEDRIRLSMPISEQLIDPGALSRSLGVAVLFESSCSKGIDYDFTKLYWNGELRYADGCDPNGDFFVRASRDDLDDPDGGLLENAEAFEHEKANARRVLAAELGDEVIALLAPDKALHVSVTWYSDDPIQSRRPDVEDDELPF